MTTAITYRIHLDEPAIFSTLEGDPNSTLSYPYIPGSALRGMVIGAFIKAQRKRDPDFEFDAAEQAALFFSAQTRYLNAYPLINGQRSLPAPASWTIPKYKTEAERNGTQPLLISDNAFPQANDGEPGRKTKSVSGFTVVTADNGAAVYHPEMVINVHNVRARRGPDQQVFRYEALAAGQTFVGVILCDVDGDAEYLRALLENNPQVALGGSRTAGYGGATITNSDVIPNWQEAEPLNDTATILTFLSDTLLRDENGYGMWMPTPAALQTQLAHLGIACQVEPISLKTTWVGGFNRKWGLPLPQVMAIGQGSVVKLNNLQAVQGAVQRLLNEGIGERREDGFGRVVLGWQQQPRLTYAKYEPVPEADEVKLSDASKKLWTPIVQRIRDRQLEERVAGILYDRQYTVTGSISRTQLSRLRSVIANELRQAQPSRAAIAAFFTAYGGKAGGRQFENARIGGQKLREWLENPQFRELDESITSKDHYVLRLMDAVLERAYRERDQQTQPEEN